MTEFKNSDELRRKLDEFSKKLERKTKEFKERGEFSDFHGAFAEGIRKRGEAIQSNLDSAILAGRTFTEIKYELERDLNNLFGEFDQWEKQLEADAMKRTMRQNKNGR